MFVTKMMRAARCAATAAFLSSAGCKINLPEAQQPSHSVQPHQSRPLEEVPARIIAKGINNTNIVVYESGKNPPGPVAVEQVMLEPAGSLGSAASYVEDKPFKPGDMPNQYIFQIGERSDSGIKFMITVPESAEPGSLILIGNFTVACEDGTLSDFKALKPNIEAAGREGNPLDAKLTVMKGQAGMRLFPINKGTLHLSLQDFKGSVSDFTVRIGFPQIKIGAGCVVHAGVGLYLQGE